MDNVQNYILPVYQAANSDDYESIKANFIVRKLEYDRMIDSLMRQSGDDSVQHELILGRRGSGKSTLLKRIETEIIHDENLRTKYIPINLAEEQAGIYRQMDLWEQVIAGLQLNLNENIPLQKYSDFSNDQDYTRALYQTIHEICQKYKKKAVLLLDNFDRIISAFDDDGNLLREILINYNDLCLIAASTRMDEHFWRYDKPFYEFFRRHSLEKLNRQETLELLRHWSLVLNRPEIENFINEYSGKVETVRLLTDGLPRTMRFFLEIVLQNKNPVNVDYLKKIMDEATPLYQERLLHLPLLSRKIVLEMAFIWEACSTKQLVKKCKMKSKLIAANLKTLTAQKIIETIPTNKRNHLYRISERFFNMWLMITQGNPEQKRNARWLSLFLENWYEPSEKNYRDAIENGDNETLWNLSVKYYRQNKNKEKVKQYINEDKGNHPFLILIEIWLGIFDNVENRVFAAVTENLENISLLSRLINDLLIQHQKTLVERLFQHPEFGNDLQKKCTVLYYVSQILNGKANENNLTLRIPPELESTVQDVLNEIETQQKFYDSPSDEESEPT
jgi:adenylate kinase family enzyme